MAGTATPSPSPARTMPSSATSSTLPEYLLPRPVLFNAALYAAIALVYSTAFFAIDAVRPNQYVFAAASTLRRAFATLAVCSWPVLLFGGLILVAVRVGANVARRRRRRHRRRRRRRAAAEAAAVGTDVDDDDERVAEERRSRRDAADAGGKAKRKSKPKSKSRPGSVPPSTKPPSRATPDPSPSRRPLPPKPPSPPSVPSSLSPPSTKVPPAASKTRSSSPSSKTSSQSPPPLPRAEPTPASATAGKTPSTGKRSASASASPSSRHSSHKSLHKSHSSRSAKSRGSRSSSRLVPLGFVSVTRAQKLYAAVGFLWVSLGLAATAAAAGLVFAGQRERHRLELADIGRNGHMGWREWAIASLTGLVFVVLFFVLAVSTMIKVFATCVSVPHDLELFRRIPTGADLELGAASGAASSRAASDDEAGGTRRMRTRPARATPDMTDDDDNDGGNDTFDDDYYRRVARDGDGGGGGGDPELRYESGTDQGRSAASGWSTRVLAFEPDDATVQRLMRQLRDMGFANSHENRAALEAASFDLEKASDKLANARPPLLPPLPSPPLPHSGGGGGAAQA